ncbi:unnamed protein product, partial [Amoebophrya sp. A25]
PLLIFFWVLFIRSTCSSTTETLLELTLDYSRKIFFVVEEEVMISLCK